MHRELSAGAALVELEAPQVINTSAITSDFFSLKNVDRVAVVVAVGSVHSAADSFYANIKQATAVAGTSAKDLTIPSRAYKYTASDDLRTAVTVEDDGTIELAPNSIFVIDILPDELDVDNDFDCIALRITAPGAGKDVYIAAHALCYHMKQVSSVLTD